MEKRAKGAQGLEALGDLGSGGVQEKNERRAFPRDDAQERRKAFALDRTSAPLATRFSTIATRTARP